MVRLWTFQAETGSRGSDPEDPYGGTVEFLSEIPIRFGDVDPAGIVYYPTYFHYYHSAFEEFFGACHGVSYAVWARDARVGFPTVHVEADFRRPLSYGDRLRVAVTIPRLGARSVDFRFEARGLDDAEGEVVCGDACVTKVCVDMERFEPRDIPEDLRTVFRRYRGPEPGGEPPCPS